MNPDKFLQLLPEKVSHDLFHPHEKIPNKDIFSSIQDNSFIYNAYKVNIQFNEYMIQNNTSYEFYKYMMASVDASGLETQLQAHIHRNLLYYMLMLFFGGGPATFLRAIEYAAQMHIRHRNDAIAMYMNSLLAASTLDGYFKQFYGHLASMFNGTEHSDRKVSMRIYKSLLVILYFIYLRCYTGFMSTVGSKINSMGKIPMYWPLNFKMRLRLLAETMHADQIFDHVRRISKCLPIIYPLQHKKPNTRLTFHEIVYFLDYLPWTDIHFEELETFAHTIYRQPDPKYNSHLIVPNPRTLDRSLLLRQYVILRMPNWEHIWYRLKWPLNRHIIQNIRTYRSANVLPNVDFLKRVLFFPLITIINTNNR